jgi:hypothetical protein
LGDAGPLLDAEATRAYRRRIEELREDLDEARRANDLGRIARTTAELNVLREQLTAAAR